MVATTEHLMTCGFRVTYGYTQSDEISLLFHLGEDSFGRKLRKLNSILAGEASAKFSLGLGDIGAFDCRICQLPSKSKVVDYFRWRNEDANRNALNAHTYWLLRKKGLNKTQATEALDGKSTGEKNELLFRESGLNFNEFPSWQKRGVALYWANETKKGFNPITQQEESAERRVIKTDYDLPIKDEYSTFIRDTILAQASE